MSAYVFLKIQKLKSPQVLVAAYKHNKRIDYCDNAKSEASSQNRDLVERTETYVEYVNRRIAEANVPLVRSNSVRAVDMVIAPTSVDSAKNDLFDLNKFCPLAVEWVNDTFGEDNVVAVHLHMDESKPHVHAVIVPITKDGRLCAKEVIGGKQKLRQFQTSIAKKLSVVGLKRGKELSSAHHIAPKQYRAEREERLEFSLPETFPGESVNQYRFRATVAIRLLLERKSAELDAFQKELEETKTKLAQYRNPDIVRFDPEILLYKKEKELKDQKAEHERLLAKNKELLSKQRMWDEILIAVQQRLLPPEDIAELRRLLPEAQRLGEIYKNEKDIAKEGR